MVKFRKLATALADMLPDGEKAKLLQDLDASAVVGFTDTIKQIFRQTYPNGMTPMQVRAALQAMGFDLSGQSNPMASIHSVIRRLLEKVEIESIGDPNMGGYRWKPSPGEVAMRAALAPRRPPLTPGEAKRIIAPFRPKKD